MKTFLGISLLAVTVTIATLVAVAEPAAPAAGRAPARGEAFRHAKMAVIAQRLDLTAAQKAKWKDLRQQTASAVQAVRANNDLTEEQKTAQIKSLRQSARDQMRAVLTADQRAKLGEIRSHPRMLNALAMHRMRMGLLARRLGLTSEQMAGIRDIRAKTMAAVKPIRADASLTPDAKRAKVREVVQAGRAQIRALLTPEQRAKVERMRRRLLAPLGPLG
jgi:Spy/CpxP family protein refolding chaperone